MIRRKPPGFTLLIGYDARYGDGLEDGAEGGILASAHVDPQGLLELGKMREQASRFELAAAWKPLSTISDLLFAEPNPAPLKHYL